MRPLEGYAFSDWLQRRPADVRPPTHPITTYLVNGDAPLKYVGNNKQAAAFWQVTNPDLDFVEKRFSEFPGGKKRFSEFLGGKKRFSEFPGGRKRNTEGSEWRKGFSEFP